MSTNLSENRRGRLTRVYDEQERAAIYIFKDQYMDATSSGARKTIAQVYIFPALFNYWVSIGKDIDAEKKAERTLQLIGWLRNTWRKKAKERLSKQKQYRLTDVLWWTRTKEVLMEIASIMNLESVTTNTPDWFQHRTTAAKNILNGMSDVEINRLREEADEMAKKGLPEIVQRKLAEEKWKSRFSKTAKESYREMGLVSISVVAYTRKNGQLAVDIHDNIADIVRVQCRSFQSTHPEKVIDFLRLVMDYVKTVGPGAGAGAGSGAGSSASPGNNIFELDDSGYPIIPCSTSWKKTKKGDLEKIYRSYMTQHYRLASGVQGRQVPFTRISKKPSDFIQTKYIPRGITLNDPRGMKRDDMIKFLEHIGSRQASHGVKDAFRFKAVLSSRKKGSLCDSKYIDSPDPRPALAGTLGPTNQVASAAPRTAAGPVLTSNPALGPAPPPAFQTSNNSSAPYTPTLIHDPNYNFVPPGDLDQSLDPDHLFPHPEQSFML